MEFTDFSSMPMQTVKEKSYQKCLANTVKELEEIVMDCIKKLEICKKENKL